MKQNTGWFAAIGVAVAALFGFSVLPTRNAPATKGPETESKIPSVQEGLIRTDLLPPCAEIWKRVNNIISVDRPVVPKNCYQKDISLDKLPDNVTTRLSGLQIFIATLPDPVHTHFSLEFDRLVESVQHAAQAEGFDYSSSWLPWVEQPRQYGGLKDQDEADGRRRLREGQPGVLVFRRTLGLCAVSGCTPGAAGNCAPEKPCHQGMAVFVVGETPTEGINRQQFENAFAWVEALHPGDSEGTLKLLGPSFSGSLPSLANIIDAHFRSTAAPKGAGTGTHVLTNATVASGTISSKAGIEWFSTYLTGKGWGSFVSLQQDDETMINRYCRLLDRLGYDIGRLAIIGEDDTAYGAIGERQDEGARDEKRGAQFDECGKDKAGSRAPLFLSYPRDIASLRSAYSKQSMSMNQPSGQQGSRLGLPEDLSESDRKDDDTVRMYGGQQTLLSQESTLFQIVDRLKSDHIEFILLRSSNSLDQIFLTYFFGRAYPDARVVLVNSDVKLVRSAEIQGFRGTMALSTYPLLTLQQDWALPRLLHSPRTQRMFPDSGSNGLYLASLFLFQQGSGDPSLAIAQRDYGPPWWLHEDPGSRPTWLTVLGAGELWPVAIIDEQTIPPQKDLAHSARQKPPSRPWHSDAGFRVPLRMSASIVICLALAFLACVWHLYCCWTGSETVSRFWQAHFVPSGPQHRILIFFGGMLFALFAAIVNALTTTSSDAPPPFHYSTSIRLYGWLITGLAVIALAVSYSRDALVPCEENRIRPKDSWIARMKDALYGVVRSQFRKIYNWMEKLLGGKLARIILGAVAFTVLTAVLKYFFTFTMTSHLNSSNDVFTVWRSVNLFSGVSPMAPLLLLVLGAYGWFWYNLRGLAMFNADRPRLPQNEDIQSLPFSSEGVAIPVEEVAKPLGATYLQRLPEQFVIVAGILILAVYTDTRGVLVRSFGTWTYGAVYSVWLCVCISVIVADAFQMLRVWMRLRRLLHALDCLPLRRILYALKGFSWGTVWRMSGNVLQRRYRLLSRQMESIVHLRNSLECATGNKQDAKSCLEIPPAIDASLEQQLDLCHKSMLDFAHWYTRISNGQIVETKTVPKDYQEQLARTAGAVFVQILRPQWNKETQSLSQDISLGHSENVSAERRDICFPAIPEFQRQAEEFFALPYLGFIQNILGRMRTMSMGMLWLFITATLSVVSYPFDPRPLLGGVFLSLLVLVGGIVSLVYGSMHRNTTLSHITNTTPGELGWSFWVKLGGLGIGPLLAVLTALFPGIAGFVTSWLQPGAQPLQ